MNATVTNLYTVKTDFYHEFGNAMGGKKKRFKENPTQRQTRVGSARNASHLEEEGKQGGKSGKNVKKAAETQKQKEKICGFEKPEKKRKRQVQGKRGISSWEKKRTRPTSATIETVRHMK